MAKCTTPSSPANRAAMGYPISAVARLNPSWANKAPEEEEEEEEEEEAEKEEEEEEEAG